MPYKDKKMEKKYKHEWYLKNSNVRKRRIDSNPKPKFSQIELGYITGLIDGEGSISLTWDYKKDNKKRKVFLCPRITIQMTHKETIDKVHKLLMRSNFIHSLYEVSNRSKYYKKHYKNIYRIQMYRAEEIFSLLKIIKPILITKKKQAKLLIEFCESRFKRKYLAYTDREWAIYKEMRGLNKRGV